MTANRPQWIERIPSQMTPTTNTTTTDLELLGLRASGEPIWLHRGAGGGWSGFTVDEPDGGDGNEPDETEEDDEDQEAEYTPPTREEWQKTRDAIKRNNSENKRHRLLKRALLAEGIDLDSDDGLAALTEAVKGRGSSNKGDAASVRRAAEREKAKVESRYKGALAKTAAKAALADAGWSGKNIDRVMAMIDLDDVDVDDEGNITGIAEQVADLKADIPEWFRGSGKPAAEQRRGASEVDGGERKTKTGGSMTWLDKVDRQMTGR